jgi:hypothetical protein
VPIVIGTVLDNLTFSTFQVQASSTTTATISVFNTAGTRIAVAAQWIAIGQ